MQINTENSTIRLSHGDERTTIRDKFIPRFKKLPSDVVKEGGDMDLYAAVAARLYKELLPDIADKISQVREDFDAGTITPCVIKGTSLGYVRNLINTNENRITGSHRVNRMEGHSSLKDSSSTKTAKATEEAHHILGLTMSSLLGCHVDRFYLNSDAKESQSSEPHTHDEYSIVIGLGDANGVNTNLLDDQDRPILSTELNRGDIFIFPPKVNHDVDEIESRHLTRKDGDGNIRTRKTFAYFAEPSNRNFSKDQLDKAEKAFLYSEKELSNQNARSGR